MYSFCVLFEETILGATIRREIGPTWRTIRLTEISLFFICPDPILSYLRIVRRRPVIICNMNGCQTPGIQCGKLRPY